MTQAPAPRTEHEAPRNGLEYLHYAVSPQTDDDFLSQNNVGLGDYNNSEFHQQLDTFADVLYAGAAFEQTLLGMASHKAKLTAAREGFEHEETTEHGSRTVEIEAAAEDVDDVEAYAEEQWEQLDVHAQLAAIRQFTTFEPGQHSPPAREFLARHELSRSKGGTLVKGALTDTKEVERVERRE